MIKHCENISGLDAILPGAARYSAAPGLIFACTCPSKFLASEIKSNRTILRTKNGHFIVSAANFGKVTL